MPRKRTVAVATSVSAALVASTTAFAVANGIFGAPPSDRVGTYHVVEQQLAPTTMTGTPTSVATTTHSTASSVPQHEHETEPDSDGRDRDD